VIRTGGLKQGGICPAPRPLIQAEDPHRRTASAPGFTAPAQFGKKPLFGEPRQHLPIDAIGFDEFFFG